MSGRDLTEFLNWAIENKCPEPVIARILDEKKRREAAPIDDDAMVEKVRPNIMMQLFD